MDSVTYPCGCVNRVDPSWGVLKNVLKCQGHQAEGGQVGRAHFEDMGAIVDGIPRCQHYVDELLDALPQLATLRAEFTGWALEIGCGASMYASWLLGRGFQYTGLDLDEWGTRWTGSTFCVPTIHSSFEDAKLPEKNWEVILAAHCLEHFQDAPAALNKMFKLLVNGGELILLLPDDSDPVNPDHLWFFSAADIRRVLETLGFSDVVVEVRKHIERENFLYVNAKKFIQADPVVLR